MYQIDVVHEEIIRSRKPILAYNEANFFEGWRDQVRVMLTEVLGDMPEERCPLDIRIEWEKEQDAFFEKRMIFTSERNVEIPCHLWIPRNVALPCPVVICLQGHSSGMHISMGRKLYAGDENVIANGDRDIAVQAINNGYAALIIEQRGFGELKSAADLKRNPSASCTCHHAAMTASLIGRTLIGERVWDVSRAIDLLETMPELIDVNKIMVTGNSGGGTVTYYAACVEPRISLAAPSCSICSFKDSIAMKRHCACNYIPRIAKYVDMGDLACLIAPRPLIIVAGQMDKGFHIEGTREIYETVQKIYEQVGASKNCRLLEGVEGHRYYADLTWPVVHELFD